MPRPSGGQKGPPGSMGYGGGWAPGAPFWPGNPKGAWPRWWPPRGGCGGCGGWPASGLVLARDWFVGGCDVGGCCMLSCVSVPLVGFASRRYRFAACLSLGSLRSSNTSLFVRVIQLLFRPRMTIQLLFSRRRRRRRVRSQAGGRAHAYLAPEHKKGEGTRQLQRQEHHQQQAKTTKVHKCSPDPERERAKPPASSLPSPLQSRPATPVRTDTRRKQLS